MHPNSKTQLLAETLEQIGASLESCGEHHWAKHLRGDAAKLRSDDVSGITDFLGAFGGMGSLNDISIRYDDPINRRIGEAWGLAKALARHYKLANDRNA